jgi:signal transduction histidine kinase
VLKKLYRKLYLFTGIVLTTSMILTTTIINLIIHRDFQVLLFEMGLNILFILVFLALFLNPFSKFVLNPFNQLMKSINNISNNNFSTMIHINKKSEYREIAEAFNNMILKIQEIVNDKQKLIAYVSHELKTPLTKIQIAQELLLLEGKGKEKYIKRTIQETENLNKMIDEMLETSEFELSFNKSSLNKVDFKEIVEKNVEKNNILFEKNNLKINMNLSEEPVFLDLNQKLMDHALNNIFSNIVKYAPCDSEVDLVLKEVNHKVVFSVRDYGPGVQPENLEKIFEPFYRTDSSRKKKIGGNGLGLSLVKKITELHGGKVWACSPNDNKSGFVMVMEI